MIILQVELMVPMKMVISDSLKKWKINRRRSALPHCLLRTRQWRAAEQLKMVPMSHISV